MTQPYGRVGVVIAEEGAASGRHAVHIRKSGAELLVLKQRPNELPEVFARRCRERIAEVERVGARIVEARLVGGGKERSERVLARAALIRLLLAPMVRHGQGKLVLAGSGEDRLAMMGLGAVIREQIRGTGVAIVPDFEDSTEEHEHAFDDAAGEARA